ncbi:hypothetical protein HBH69_095010 [Parastagonospora nodorum]|nr:hypothetical protein HBH47_110620 [Parastagonospora nodorum]KAH4215089.1 hypothetical protein HBI95_016800 [Parastagonospora nodorum]KAH4236649.1 hypothetical protein HBI06_052790 [Parastagonospora nodorum]KAH4248716.1 hypothetical protein HBI05_023130 [Parastagonospora nodorum]KAH4611511.1 hypothetical protein HBH82_040250 [Parastagonospora nodorum]
MSFDLFPCHKTISFLHALRAYKSRHSATLSIHSNITLLSFSFQKKRFTKATSMAVESKEVPSSEHMFVILFFPESTTHSMMVV